MEKKKCFNKGEKIYFLKDYELDHLSVGWIYKKGRFENNKQYWKLIEDEEALNVQEDLIDGLQELKEYFIVNDKSKILNKYTNLSKFLHNSFISNNVDTKAQKAMLFTSQNNRIRIFFIALFSFLKTPIYYFFSVILLGIVKLIFGDVAGYFKNEHNLFFLTRKLHYAKYKEKIWLSISTNGKTEVSNDVEKIQEEINNKKKENIEINRSIIATVVALVSLYFSLIPN